MKTEDIDIFCKSIKNIDDPDLINKSLDKVSKEDLLDLTNKFLENPFRFKHALVSALHRLFDDTPEFAELLNKFLESTYLDSLLREEMIKQQNLIFSLVKRMVHVGKRPGTSAGILLSWIVQKLDEAKKIMVEGLNSRDIDLQRCSLITLNSVICNANIQDKNEYLDILKNITTNILQENTGLLITCLQCAFENDANFESILESEINRRSIIGAKEYIQIVHGRSKISTHILEKAVEMLESGDPESEIIDMGLAKIFEHNPDFVVERLQKRLLYYRRIKLADEFLLWKINEIGSEPVLRMIESQIDNGNPVLLNIGESIVEDFIPKIEDWVAWCEKWKDDAKKENIILKSLGLILTKLINYKSSEVRDKAIALVKDFAIRKCIDYEAETRQINLKSDPNEGKENKESAIKALYILEKMLNPPVSIDVKIFSENLKRAPHLSKAIDAKWLIESASKRNPHPLAYIFHHKLPEKGELKSLREKLEKEEDKDKRFWLAFEYERLLRSIKYQFYWENVFKILEQYHITIRKSKLHDIYNAWSILAEAEVLSRLAPYFNIITEPDIPELSPKKLEALIEYDGEKALVEVAAVQERLEVLLAHGGISVPGGKVKNVLLNKFKGQLKEGKANPGIPIIIVLSLEHFMDQYEVMNAVYGAFQFSFKQRKDTHEIVEEGSTREENAFYDTEGAEIVTAIGAYRPDYDRDDPLVGKMYHPHKLPTNKTSQKFKLRLRDALFGRSEISDWKSLVRVHGIDEQMAKLLYANGIEDLGILLNLRENEYNIEGIPQEKLSQLQKEAIRVAGAISTGSVKFLKGMNQKTHTILHNNGIYLIKKILELEAPPEGISHEIWSLIKEDAKRISA